MSNILVFLQHHDGKILKASLGAISAAQELKKAWSKGDLNGLCLGANSKQMAGEAAKYGLSKVFYCENPALEKFTAENYAEMIKAGAEKGQADTIVCSATSSGKDVLATVAALIGAGQASDIIGINSDGSIKRPMYAGNAIADVQLECSKRCVSVRSTAFQPSSPQGSAGAVEELSYTASAVSGGEVLGYELSGGDRPELSEAEVVVSGGRALQSSENFQKYIFPLADALGAAVGASRAAVDSGYAPNDWQVGQTGKVVAPSLYFAVGISGAIQHLAGMKDSKVIVAINKDPDAPIFEVADYGLVADLFQAVPSLTDAIKKAKAG